MNSTCLLLKALYFKPWLTLFTLAHKIGYGLSNSNDGSMSINVVPSGKVLLVCVLTQKIFTIKSSDVVTVS